MSTLLMRTLLDAIEPNVSSITATTVVTAALKRIGYQHPQDAPMSALGPQLADEVARGLRFYRVPERRITECSTRLRAMYRTNTANTRASNDDNPVSSSHLRPGIDAPHIVPIDVEDDIVKARSEARELAKRIGFSSVDQVKIATVVSELARNIISYANRGVVKIVCSCDHEPGIEIVASDSGPGIRNLDEILKGNYVSKTGMGLGLLGSRRIMDNFTITTGAWGTRVVVRKLLRA